MCQLLISGRKNLLLTCGWLTFHDTCGLRWRNPFPASSSEQYPELSLPWSSVAQPQRFPNTNEAAKNDDCETPQKNSRFETAETICFSSFEHDGLLKGSWDLKEKVCWEPKTHRRIGSNSKGGRTNKDRNNGTFLQRRKHTMFMNENPSFLPPQITSEPNNACETYKHDISKKWNDLHLPSLPTHSVSTHLSHSICSKPLVWSDLYSQIYLGYHLSMLQILRLIWCVGSKYMYCMYITK